MSNKSSLSANVSIENCEISDLFRSFRDRTGMKQSDLAALLGVHSNYLSQIERGEKKPGPRLVKDFYTLTRSPVYNIASEETGAESMPPHHEPPGLRLRGDPPPFGSPGDFDFAQCIKWLSELHERHPQAFRSAAAMIKGLHESMKK